MMNRYAWTRYFWSVGLSACWLLGWGRSLNAQEQLVPQFEPNPYLLSGTSGGSQYTADCGYLDRHPNFTVVLTEPIAELQLSVAAEADVTLVVETPQGRLCSDDAVKKMPQLSGDWTAGEYFIWVGDWGESSPFTLSISRPE